MRAGESVVCPHCGERTVVKTKTVTDGWRVAGTRFVCVLCGGELGAPEKEQGGDSVASAKRAMDRFASLLGDGAEAAAKADLSPDENYGRFCRNCVHFLEHPFRPLCDRDGKAADPMGECGEFTRKR